MTARRRETCEEVGIQSLVEARMSRRSRAEERGVVIRSPVRKSEPRGCLTEVQRSQELRITLGTRNAHTEGLKRGVHRSLNQRNGVAQLVIGHCCGLSLALGHTTLLALRHSHTLVEESG